MQGTKYDIRQNTVYWLDIRQNAVQLVGYPGRHRLMARYPAKHRQLVGYPGKHRLMAGYPAKHRLIGWIYNIYIHAIYLDVEIWVLHIYNLFLIHSVSCKCTL